MMTRRGCALMQGCCVYEVVIVNFFLHRENQACTIFLQGNYIYIHI